MTKRDFRQRRNLFRGKMNRGDFDSFMQNYDRKKESPRSSRTTIMLIILLAVAIVIYYILGVGF